MVQAVMGGGGRVIDEASSRVALTPAVSRQTAEKRRIYFITLLFSLSIKYRNCKFSTVKLEHVLTHFMQIIITSSDAPTCVRVPPHTAPSTVPLVLKRYDTSIRHRHIDRCELRRGNGSLVELSSSNIPHLRWLQPDRRRRCRLVLRASA